MHRAHFAPRIADEGCHLISKGPEASPLFHEIIAKTSAFFNVKPAGVRFNWYRDASDWKPFHHDSAAFNRQRAKTQDITVGISFGASRELAFLHAEAPETKRARDAAGIPKDAQCIAPPMRVYFPQENGMAFSFGRDVNIRCVVLGAQRPVRQHALRALQSHTAPLASPPPPPFCTAGSTELTP
jgi:hypothetical protein